MAAYIAEECRCENYFQSFRKGLEKALSNLIRSNQKAFVNGRSIFDPIRTIDDIVDYTKRNNWSGILIAIGFEKASDTLDRTVVYEDLELENLLF